MAAAQIRFYAELNDYLAPALRHGAFPVEFAPPCPVRHLIESLGVPHTEVEIVLLNGVSVDLETHVADADRISVYPMFEAFDVTPLLRLRTRPLRDPRFFADAQLGRLARHLRLLGFDTLFEPAVDDADLVRRAAEQHRIVLSRDRALLMRREVSHGCHIRRDDPFRQLIQVVRRCDLADRVEPFSRCMECNGLLDRTGRDEVAALLEPATCRYYAEFWRCRGCGRIYWKGSHFARLEALVERTLAAARRMPA